MKTFTLLLLFTIILSGCQFNAQKPPESMTEFQYQTEQFADIRILRYHIPGFDELSLEEKKLIYYLHEAALAGRDIYWDQNYKHNLSIRKTLEQIIKHYNGDRDSESFRHFLTYAKRVFVSNGIHHHYSTQKILPEFNEDYFIELVNNSPEGNFPLEEAESISELLKLLLPAIFDSCLDARRVNLDPQADMALQSANNFYENVNQEQVVAFYKNLHDPDDPTPVSHGLNSRLSVHNEEIVERIWKINGLYSPAIERIVASLSKARGVAQNPHQRKIIQALIEFYETGDLEKFDEYSILWVQDTISDIDFTNGFIEVYGDPFGIKGAYQAMVYLKDHESSVRTSKISSQAQWFEDNLPVHPDFRKEKAMGISARAVNIAAVAGDNSPTPPLGVNLPNADWIRREHGSKSITISNIAMAYDMANKESGVLQEFARNAEELALAKEYGFLANNLHTDLHEIVGHGSGRLRSGVADMSITLKNYASVIEETRADLVGLYFMMDPFLVETGIIPTTNVGKAHYNQYIKNGLMLQLYRIQPGQNLEQAHMRNRQLIASWVYEKGKDEQVISREEKDGKTFFVVNDHMKLRALFGELLTEVQRIKSEGDYNAARELVETYGVVADQQLLSEVHQRYIQLNIPPYAAFINPVFTPVIRNNRIVDIHIHYPKDFLQQMLYYADRYSFLPAYN